MADDNGARDGLHYLQQFRDRWNAFDGFLIEVSSYRDYFFERDEVRRYVNTFTKRDLANHDTKVETAIASGRFSPVRASDIEETLTSTGSMLQAMRRIKDLLNNRPIVWVSHINLPSPSPSQLHVHAVRKRLAETLKVGTQALGDTFFDPEMIIAKLGAENALDKAGADLDHYTPAGIDEAARCYFRILKGREPKSTITPATP